MKGHHLILWGSVLFLIAVTNWSIVIAVNPTNTTILKTPANATVLEKQPKRFPTNSVTVQIPEQPPPVSQHSG